ncbi:hypothetical protein SAMN05660330_03158 [Desulforhopalus singaporensis]|uniref:Uncharacterized protein n=1 Tax=Desulforhopalus singaporensis TaxID=91360 RepID=A0A1H0TM87_9BACT|nr:hypothetical protein SAMN05660330_03158 [Desulforhopalus singaporensis]
MKYRCKLTGDFYLTKLFFVDAMEKCKNHREVSGDFYCQKYQTYLCRECARCSDLKMYCKFRSACLINFHEKERRLNER